MNQTQHDALAALAVASQTLTATAAAVAEAERVLRASLMPAEPPAPPPPAENVVRSRLLSLSRMLLIDKWSPDFSRYTRAQGVLRLVDDATVKVFGYDLASGGKPRGVGGGTYTLTVDGKDAAVLAAAAGAQVLEFPVKTADFGPGWHWLDVRCDTGETCPPYGALFVVGGKSGPSTFTPVARGSYETGTTYQWTDAPARYAPTPRPLAKREAASFFEPLPRKDLHCTHLVPLRGGDTYRVGRTLEGELTSASVQPYHWHQMVAKLPNVPLLDGPRGEGTVCMNTHLEWGRAVVPELGGWVGNLYGCDPWRVFKVRPDGEVVTLLGFRHSHPMPREKQDLELVGDWSAIPPERRGLHECWGLAWDERTFAIDEAADPIPSERNLRPHVTGVVMFVADSQNNRVLRAEFDPRSHATPVKITEFLTGLNDPWDAVCRNGLLYVSERLSHRIAVYDATTAALVKVLVQGQPLASVNHVRDVVSVHPLATRRAAPCVAPEGLYLQDQWLYFGSRALSQVRRVDIDTGSIEVVCEVGADDNVKFHKIAVSDGSFGPKGTVFISKWSNRQHGMPETRLPGGGEWFWWDSGRPGAGNWAQFNYVSAVAVGFGRLAVGGATEGILMITKRQPAEGLPSALVEQGRKEFVGQGLDLLHGDGGFGFYGLPLPFGKSEAIDAYLAWTHA